MKRILWLGMLALVCSTAHADVVIDRYKPMEPTMCAPVVAESRMVKNVDGSYTWISGVSATTMNLRACAILEQRWKERWTDLPENGGQLIEVLQ